MALIPSLLPWVKGSSIAAAAARIQSLTQELPCATGVATKKKKKKKKKKKSARKAGYVQRTAFGIRRARVQGPTMLCSYIRKNDIVKLPRSISLLLRWRRLTAAACGRE